MGILGLGVVLLLVSACSDDDEAPEQVIVDNQVYIPNPPVDRPDLDLTIGSISNPVQLTVQFDVPLTIENIGEIAAEYVDDDPETPPDPNSHGPEDLTYTVNFLDNTSGAVVVAYQVWVEDISIASGASITPTIELTLPDDGTIPAGTYDLRVHVSPPLPNDEDVGEVELENNTAIFEDLLVGPSPDII